MAYEELTPYQYFFKVPYALLFTDLKTDYILYSRTTHFNCQVRIYFNRIYRTFINIKIINQADFSQLDLERGIWEVNEELFHVRQRAINHRDCWLVLYT